MIGLDTNVLARYIMQDDPKQSAKAVKLIESLDRDSPGYITIVSVVERADQVLRALRVFAEGKADFPDCLIERTAADAGCAQTMTFDMGAAKHAGMTLIH